MSDTPSLVVCMWGFWNCSRVVRHWEKDGLACRIGQAGLKADLLLGNPGATVFNIYVKNIRR